MACYENHSMALRVGEPACYRFRSATISVASSERDSVMPARIPPLAPPYSPELSRELRKWVPPAAALELSKWLPSAATLEPLALFRTLARHELLFERMRPLGGALLGHGLLPARTRELLILRTCARCGAEYEWGVHVAAFAASVGLERSLAEQTQQAAVAELAADDADDAQILRFADELHDHSRVSDATYNLLSARYTPEQLLEMSAVVGFYHLISFVINVARVELEPWATRFAGAAATNAP